MSEDLIAQAARLIRAAHHLSAFTGAGVSAESGIPPFRGEGGLWNTYDPRTLELDYFLAHPDRAWPVIREIFYDHFGSAEPNPAHLALARLENEGWPQGSAAGAHGCLEVLITQNIDDLHFRAGSRHVVEFHGSSRRLVCLTCRRRYEAAQTDLTTLPPHCACGGILKPDFIFFGEVIPAEALVESEKCAARTDVMIVVGTTGEVYPAAAIPRAASSRGAKIIEINPEKSAYTDEITDIFLRLPAGRAMNAIERAVAEGS